MKLLKYEEFEREYSSLNLFFCLLTEEAIKKANTELYKTRAEACDYYSMILLLFYDKSAIELQFVKDKWAAIVIKVRNGSDEAEKILRQIEKAARGENPYPGRKKKLPEAIVLMREYAVIIMELQKLQPPKGKYIAKKIFDNSDSQFCAHVRKIYEDNYRNDPYFKCNPGEIVDSIEGEFRSGIPMPFEFALQIMAKKYDVVEDTIKKTFKKGFMPQLRSRFKAEGNLIDKQFVEELLNSQKEAIN